MTFFTFAQYERLISFFASVLYDPLVQDSQWDSLACTTRSGRVWVKGQRLCLSDHRLAAKWAWSQTQPQNTPHSSHASQFYGGQHMHIIYAHLSNQAFSPGTCTIDRLLGLLSPDPKKKKGRCVLPELLGAFPTKALNDTALEESISLCSIHLQRQPLKKNNK